MSPIITLLTDFGLSDTYVGQMKGVIVAINPAAAIVDLTHEVRPQAVMQGAFLLEMAVAAFPPEAIHVAVVDPGVGGSRRGIALRTERGIFVGPDNGLLSGALPETLRPDSTGPRRVVLPSFILAVELQNPAFRRPTVAPTFHGRDIFAPAAAHLSLNVSLDRLGPPVGEMVALPPFRARRSRDGRVHARVIHLDRFGNVVTDARAEDLPGPTLVARCGAWRAEGLVTTYEVARGLVALVGSAGYLEIAVPGGSAAAQIGATIGDPVVIEPG